MPQAAWQSKKARDLVKILVSRRGRPASREMLMDALWPGEDPARLGNRLSQALSTAAAGLVMWKAGRGEQARPLLVSAESAYTGDFLEEDLYEPWASPLREEARATYNALTRVLAEEAAATGDWDTAVRHWLRVLDRDPYDEPSHLSLVRALASAGRHGEAHRRYRFYAAAMRESGVEAVPFPTASG